MVNVVICRATPIAPDPRVEKIARTLLAGGYAVKLLGWDMTGEYPTEELVDGLAYYRCRVRADFGRGIRNLPHQLRWQVALFGWLIKYRKEYDVVHACDFDTILPALWVKRLLGKKVVYDIFDFYADMLRATPGGVKRLIRRVDLSAINQVDALVIADDSRYDQVAGSRPKRVEVIYNTPVDVLADLAHNRKPHPDGIPMYSSASPERGLLHLTYVGNLQIERGLLMLLEILRQHPEWTLDLAGFGGDEIQILAVARQLPNVFWHGRIHYEQALELNYSADVLFATYDPAIPNNRFASPNKVFEAMMLGKPILVARGTNMDRLIEQAVCGIVVDYGDSDALEKALQTLQADWGLRKQLGENARGAYETTYQWTHMQARLLKLYQEVVGS